MATPHEQTEKRHADDASGGREDATTAGRGLMRRGWGAVKPFVLPVLGVLVFMLAVVGLPLAAVVVLFFHRWFFRSTRPGKLGLEDVIGILLRLSCVCGLVMAMLMIVLGLFVSR